MPKGGARSRSGKSKKGHLRVVPSAENAETLASDRAPWERQPDETAKAYRAFCYYRDLEPDVRSIPRAHERGSGNLRVWEGWSGRWSWVDRALAWDDEQDRVRREAALDEVRRMAERHARAAQTYIAALLQPAVAILRKVNEDPQFMANLIQSNPSSALDHLGKLAKALPVVVNVERLSRGEPINITEIEAELNNTEGAREAARAILDDPEAAAIASELLDRLYGMG